MTPSLVASVSTGEWVIIALILGIPALFWVLLIAFGKLLFRALGTSTERFVGHLRESYEMNKPEVLDCMVFLHGDAAGLGQARGYGYVRHPPPLTLPVSTTVVVSDEPPEPARGAYRLSADGHTWVLGALT